MNNLMIVSIHLKIVVNLYKNAKQSMEAVDADEKIITFELYQEGSNAIVRVTDTGSGIAADKIEEIFSYGFTTKSDGHGIGLHSCANYMTEMDGKIVLIAFRPQFRAQPHETFKLVFNAIHSSGQAGVR